MINLEILQMGLVELIAKPLPIIAMFAIFGVIKLLEKPIMKAYAKQDSAELYKELVMEVEA